MVNPRIALYLPVAPLAGPLQQPLVEQLQLRGLQVQLCPDAASMSALCQPATPSPAVVLLAGTQAENCAYAMQLRLRHARVGLLATLDPRADDSLALELVHSGVDGYCSPAATQALLSALLHRLWWRVAGEAAATPAAVPPPERPPDDRWAMLEQGWVMLSPGGQRLPLTTGERAFVLALLAAPGRRASHRDLIDAINQGYALEDGPLSLSRLGVMVSRLRRKFSRHGLDLPLKSMHSWGYMFTGLVRDESA